MLFNWRYAKIIRVQCTGRYSDEEIQNREDLKIFSVNYREFIVGDDVNV